MWWILSKLYRWQGLITGFFNNAFFKCTFCLKMCILSHTYQQSLKSYRLVLYTTQTHNVITSIKLELLQICTSQD